MRMIDIIKKKRDKEILTEEEIRFFVEGFSKGEIPDYQVSALLMSIFFNKMSEEETIALTKAMIDSGETMDLSKIEGIKVDKHSTGGVGDKTTIALAPIIAAFDVPVAKMSGRGLGHTGGTLDKLEAIPGFNVSMQKEEFVDHVNRHKIAVAGQTASIVLADKKLYALRDVTATVDNISLIASSIMSKKLASGADKIVLDVKTGSGAFMKTVEDSFELAQEMVRIGNGVNKETIAVITDMNQPLGNAIGNSLEVIEAIETLKGNGPKDFTELCEILGSYMLLLSKKVKNIDEAKIAIKEIISSKKAIEKLREFIIAQGGDDKIIDDYSLLPGAKYQKDFIGESTGFIESIDAEEVGLAALVLGAGRETKESKLDLGAGIILKKKLTDFVKEGQVIATVYSNTKEKLDEGILKLKKAYKISDHVSKEPKILYGIVDKKGIHKF